MLPELLTKLSIFSSQISRPQIPTICRALYKSIPFFPKDGDSREGAATRAAGLLFQLLDQQGEPTLAQQLLEEVVRKVESLNFMASLVLFCHRRNEASFRQVTTPTYLADLRRIAAERLCKYYVRGQRDIFAELPESERLFVLYQWATDWTESETHRIIVQQYILHLVEQKPQYLGQLLRGFTQSHPFGKGLVFDLNTFAKICDPEVIIDCLDRYGEKTCPNTEEQQAAALFRQHRAEARSDRQAREQDGETEDE